MPSFYGSVQFSWIPAAQNRAGIFFRRAFHKSPPNGFDRSAPRKRGLLDRPSQDVVNFGPSSLSLSLPLGANDYHASAFGASSGHHRLPSLPAVHFHDANEEVFTETSCKKRVKKIIQRIRRICLPSDNLGFPEVRCCTFCHNVDYSGMNSLF